MRALVAHAYNWHVNALETEIPVGRYIDKWGRPGDPALIAMEGAHRLGAAWYRLFTAAAPGYGFVDEQTPELTVVVVPTRQGQGIGLDLLRSLLDHARADGHAAVSVSTERDDPEVEIFAAEGFEPLRELGNTLTLRRAL
jgi:GNAT superfamily N-acetyltransferase